MANAFCVQLSIGHLSELDDLYELINGQLTYEMAHYITPSLHRELKKQGKTLQDLDDFERSKIADRGIVLETTTAGTWQASPAIALSQNTANHKDWYTPGPFEAFPFS